MVAWSVSSKQTCLQSVQDVPCLLGQYNSINNNGTILIDSETDNC